MIAARRRGFTLPAMFVAATMIAHQVAGKAARDAIFLSQFRITALPILLMVAAVASILVVLAVSRWMTAAGPSRVTPLVFVASAATMLGAWPLSFALPKAAALVVYLQIAVFGPVVISSFWSLVNERLDPAAVKRRIGKIAGAGTLGGLIGGVLAERIGAWGETTAILPLLGVMHLACARVIHTRLASYTPRAIQNPTMSMVRELSESRTSPWDALRDAPYLRQLALLVVLGTTGASLLDYVFKAQAAETFARGDELMRFFAAFYTTVGLVTFAVQTVLSRLFLRQLGLGRTVGALPLAMTAGAAWGLVVPGLDVASIVRGSEQVLRSSLFRSGYELLFAPVPAQEKRATKTVVDVGFDRLGDVVGGGIIKVVLQHLEATALTVLLAMAAAIGLVGLMVASWLQRGYVRALERSLVARTQTLDPLLDEEAVALRKRLVRARSPEELEGMLAGHRSLVAAVEKGERERAMTSDRDPVSELIAALRSADETVVTPALKRITSFDPLLVPEAIKLLAWDGVAEHAIRALQRVAPDAVGELIDALVDPARELAARRRIPDVLGACPSQPVVDGLARGLKDERFEIRAQCARALHEIRLAVPDLELDPELVLAALRRELEGKPASPGDAEHLLTLVALMTETGPLALAMRGLYSEDEALKGTALEYLESVLPRDVRLGLEVRLGLSSSTGEAARPPREVMGELAARLQSLGARAPHGADPSR